MDSSLLEAILAGLGIPWGPEPTRTPDTARTALQAWLTARPTDAIPAAVWPLLDALWASERHAHAWVPAAAIPGLGTTGAEARMGHWHGDITTLAMDAIVNAANNGLTGCYQPFHRCIDNAIHTAAGPRLRQACERIMAARGRPEPTATATVTAGYALPARHVVHTVGPIVDEASAPVAEDRALLARCYRACLRACDDAGLRSVALCGISTGLYGYPPFDAAPVALETVRAYLRAGSHVDRVVFVTFTPTDRAAFTAACEGH